ncbi:CopG family ribbon-helix-helix protein [Thermofilum pendens]|uniref:Transcriptional regulator, CopG family n=1 Tax=Thermofilum pendens (strain DSM 2475 / Hrk 5) TaxID=368408 RepID=A1RZK4_THEPD|nr:CopG family ribbon-helix-helix protein [Thermofilum pendens]ABL78634.1 transcriptional regulator, CopG family [Thermofilum pendens Hrk 5]
MRRISLTVPDEVYKALEELAERTRISNRSRLVSDAIMAYASQSLEDGARYAGAIIVLYDHSRGETVYGVTDAQHDYPEISASLHMHLSEDLCLEVLGVRGEGGRLKNLISALRGVSGVITVQYSLVRLDQAVR